MVPLSVADISPHLGAAQPAARTSRLGVTGVTGSPGSTPLPTLERARPCVPAKMPILFLRAKRPLHPWNVCKGKRQLRGSLRAWGPWLGGLLSPGQWVSQTCPLELPLGSRTDPPFAERDVLPRLSKFPLQMPPAAQVCTVYQAGANAAQSEVHQPAKHTMGSLKS